MVGRSDYAYETATASEQIGLKRNTNSRVCVCMACGLDSEQPVLRFRSEVS